MEPTPSMGASAKKFKPSAPSQKNPWLITTIVLAVIVVVLLVGFWLKLNQSTGIAVIPSTQASDKLISFINTIYGAQIGTATLKEVTESAGLYKVKVTVNGQDGKPVDQDIFITRDGNFFIPQAINIADTLKQFDEFTKAQQQQQPTTPPPADQEATQPSGQENTNIDTDTNTNTEPAPDTQ